MTARNRRASPAPAQSVERRRGWLGPWHRRSWTSIRPNSAATDQERRAEITDGRGRDEFTAPISKYNHLDIVLILKRYLIYSDSSPAPAYAWERGRVPGGGGRGRRSSGRGVKAQAARRQAIGRREGRPGVAGPGCRWSRTGLSSAKARRSARGSGRGQCSRRRRDRRAGGSPAWLAGRPAGAGASSGVGGSTPGRR